MPTRLEELQADAQVQGLVHKETVRVISAQLMGECCQIVFRDQQGDINTQIIFRDKEADLEMISEGRKWSFAGKGDLFRLVSEA